MPLERITPNRVWSISSSARPLSRTASSAAATANWVKRAILRASRLSMRAAGSKSLTSAASFTLKSAVSKAVIGPTAQRPALMFAQLSATVLPVGFYRTKAGNNDPAFLFLCPLHTSHSHSAVNAKDLPGNIPGLLPCQKSHRRRNILGMADFACRDGRFRCGTGRF